MISGQTFLTLAGKAGMILAVLWICAESRGQTGPATHSGALERSVPLDGTAIILPSTEDLPVGVAGRVHISRRGSPRGDFLIPLRDDIVLVNALGGGSGPGPVGQHPGVWDSDIRYIVYKSQNEALANWRREDSNRSRGCSSGSFSGAKIGDACGNIADAVAGWFELQFVRNCVSVNISALVHDGKGAKELQPEIEEALETTANVIVSRIDAVVKAKGFVDMSNLPPLTVLRWDSSTSSPPNSLSSVPVRPTPPPPPPAPIDANSIITPSVEDFPSGLTEKVTFPHRSNTSRLMEVAPYIHMVDTIGGGTVPGPGSSRIRFILYRTPEDAKANWESEDHTRPDKCVAGSFSGEQIGDACRHVANTDQGQYDLGFIRGRVSAYIAWKVQPGQPARDGQALRESALEQTAKVILNRIDGVIAAKGYVDMSNLPKFLPRPKPSVPMAPPPPPPWKTK